MGLIDQHIIQLEAALAVLHSNHDHAAHDKAQQDFAKQLGVGLASRLQKAAFRPSDVSRILAAVDSTLAGNDLLGHYTKAVQVSSISTAETAVRDALEALQLSKDAIASSDRSSRQQDGLHNTSATDGQQQGLELCTRLSKQLQGHLADYKETGKQLTAIGEQLGKASEGLAGVIEQLQAPSASSQAETLSKACQDLDEVLISLAELQLAYEGSTQYTHNTNKTLKALKGLQKQYATASHGGSPQAGGRLNHIIEAQQAWNSAAAALQKDTSDISAATANLSSIHNSLATLLPDLELETGNTSAAEGVHLIVHSDAQLQQLDVQQQQQLTACTDVREQLSHLFDLFRSSSSSGGGSAGSAGTSPSPAANAAADGSLSGSPSHAAAHQSDPAGATRVAGAAHSSQSLCDLDQGRSLNSSNNDTTGGGPHVPALAAAAAMSSSPNRRCSRLGLASKAASVHNEYEAAQAAAEAAADPADATRAGGLAVAVVAQQPAAGSDKSLRWHENVLSLVEDDAQPSEPHVQQQQPEQQPQELQHQQQQRGLQSNALQQLRELQASLAAAVTAGQPLAGDELLQMCESLQQLVQQAQQETVQHQAALPAVQLTARLTSGDLGLDYSTIGSKLFDTASMLKWGNPVFRRESYPGLFDAEAMTPDSSSGGAYSGLRRMSEAQIEGVFIASVTAAAAADAGQACGASPRCSQQQYQPQQQFGLDIAVHDHCSADAEESTTPRTRSDMPDPPSRLECLDKPPSSRDMDAAAAAAGVEVDSPDPKQDSDTDAADSQQSAARQVVENDPDTAAIVAVDELLAATQEVSNRLGPHGLADLVEAAAAVEGLSDVAILVSLITHVIQHQQGVAALTARLQQQQPDQGSHGLPTAADKLAKGTSAGSTPTSTTAPAAWTIPAVYDGQQRQGQVESLSTVDSMEGTAGRASCNSEEQFNAAAAEDSSSHVSRQLTRSSTLGLPTTMEGSAVALADEDSSSLLHTTSDVGYGAAVLALEGLSGADAAIHQQQELEADVASQLLGDHRCWGNKSCSSTEAGVEGSETRPTRCCSDSSILAGASGRSLNRSDSYLTSLNKMLQAESRQLQQQVEHLQQQLAKAEAEAASLREKLRHQQQERQQQEQQIADQQQQVAELLEQLAAEQAAAAAAKDQHVAELQQQLSAAAVEADEVQQQQQQQQEELQVQLQLIEQLQQHLAAAQMEIASLTKQQHDRQQEIEELLQQHQHQLQDLQQQLVRANEQVALFTEQQASISALQDENQQLQQQNLLLQQQSSAARPESEQLPRADGEPDPSAAGSREVGALSAPVKCSSPVKKGRLPLFRRATTDAVTASCPTFALGPAAGAAAGLSGSPDGSVQGAAKRAVQGNNDNSSNLLSSLEGTTLQALPPSSGDLKEGAPKRRVTWDVNPSSAAAAAAAASAQKALTAFLGAIKGGGSGKKHLVGRVMVDGTVSIQPEDSAAVNSPVGSSEPSATGKRASVVGLIDLEDGPEQQQHLQQQQHWRQQQLQMQRLLAEQPAGISDAEEWDAQHSAFSLIYQHRSVSEIGMQLQDLEQPPPPAAAAAAAVEADIPACDNIARAEAMGHFVPTALGPVGAGTNYSTKLAAAHMSESQSDHEAQGEASVQQLLENAASSGPGSPPQQQQQVFEGSGVDTVQCVEQLAQDLRARQQEIEQLEHEVCSKAAQLTIMQQEMQCCAECEQQLTARLEAAENTITAQQSQLATLTNTVAVAETAAKAAAVAESAMAVNVLTQTDELRSAQLQLQEQSGKVQQLLLKLEHAQITVAAAYGHLGAICGTVAAAESAARAAAEAAVTPAAASELSQQAHDLQAAQQQLQQQSASLQELMSRPESAGGSAAATHAHLKAVQESVAAAIARVVVPAEQYWQQLQQQQQPEAPGGAIPASKEDNSSQQQGLSEWSADMEAAAASLPHVALELAADSNSSKGAGSSSCVTFTQLQAALASARQQLGHKEQQLLGLQDWVEFLRLGLARVRQALDSNEGCTVGKDSPQHTPVPQCKDVAVAGSSSTTNSSDEGCCLAAAAALEAATECTPAAATAAEIASWSEATGEQLVLLHEVQSIADEVKVVCCERHLLQNALQEQLRAISRLEQSLQAAKEQQGLQEAALLQLEEEQSAAANAAAEQLAAAQRAIQQHKQEQVAAAATAAEQLSDIQKAMLKHEEAQQTAAAEKIAQLEQQEQEHRAAAAEAQQALVLLTQQQQKQEKEWQLREEEYQAAAAAATQRLLELQQQQHDHEVAAAEAMQKLAEVVNQQQHQEADWQQREQEHLAAAKAAAELIAVLQEQEQDQRVTAAEALQHLAASVEQQAALEQDWQQKQQQQQAIAAETAQQLADLQHKELEEQAAAAAVAEKLAAALDQQQQLQQEQRQAANEAAATIADLQSQLKVTEQDQQAAAAAAAAQIAELQAQLQSAQQAGQSLQGKVDALQAQLGTAQEAAQQQREAEAAQQQQQAAAAAEAARAITDLRTQLQAAEQKQQNTAAEAAAAIGQLESRLELAHAVEQEQQVAAAQASAAVAALQEQLQAAQAAAQELPGLKEQLSTLCADLEAAEAHTKEERTAAAEATASLAELQTQLHAAQAAQQEQQAAAAESAAQVADMQSHMQAAQTVAQQVPLLKQEISTLHAQLEAAYAETEEVAAKAFAALQQETAAAAAADESKALAEQAAAAQVAAHAATQTARHDLALLQQQYSELSSQKTGLTSELAVVQQQRRNAEQQVSELQQQLDELSSLHDVLMQQLQRMDQSTDGPLDAASSPESAAVAAGFDLQYSSKPLTSKVDQVRCITQQLQQLWSAHSRAQELTLQLAAAEQALQQQKNTAFAAHARAADHRLAAAELSSESLAAAQQAEQARQQQAAAVEVQGLWQQITDLRSELTAADQARQQQEHAAAAAEAEARSLRQQICALTAEVQQLQSESEQMRRLQHQAAAAAAGVEAQGLKQLAALQSECDGMRQQMQAMCESCTDRDREIEAQQQQLAHLQAELADLTELNQQLEAAAAAAIASSQVATIDATVQTKDTTNSSSSNAGPVDQRILTSCGSMTLRNSLRGSREGEFRVSSNGGLRTSRDGTEQQQQDAFTLMQDLSAYERELADLKAVLQGREATLAGTNQELMLVQQSMAELQDQLAELQAGLHMVRTEAAVKVAAANNKALASQQAARQSQEVASAAALHSSKADSSMVQQLQHQLKMLQGQLAAEQEGRLRDAAAFAIALKQASAGTANAQAAASDEIMQLQAELGHNMQLVQQQADQLQQQAEQLQQHEQQQQQHEEQLQSSRDEVQQLQQQLAERSKQLQQQQGVLQQLRQTVAQLQRQLHMLQDQILGRQQQQQQAAAGKHRSSDLGGVICAEFIDRHAEGPLTQALSRGVSPTDDLVLRNPQQQQGAEPPSLAQENQQLRLQLMVKQHTISKLQKQLAEVTAGQTAPLSPPGAAPAQITQIGGPSRPNLGQASTSDRIRSLSDRTRSASETADAAALASLRQHAAMLEGVLLEVQAESAAKDDIMQELTQQAELRVGAGYARTEELRRLYRDMASKDAYISRLESRVRAMTSRTPSPTQPPQHEQQQMPTDHKPQQQQQQQQQQQRVIAKDRGQVVGLPAEYNLVPKRSYVQLQAQLQAANTGQQQQRAAAGRAGNGFSAAAAAAAATLKQRAAARLQGNGQAAAVAPEASSEGGAHPTVGMYADKAEAMDAAAGVAGQACSAGSSNSNSNNGSLSARPRVPTASSGESIISGQVAAVAAVGGGASAISKVSPRLQQQRGSSSSSAEAGGRRSLTGVSWQQPGVVGSSSSSSSRAKSKSTGNVSASNARGDSIVNPISHRTSPQITSLEPAGNPIYTLNSDSHPQMWVSNTLYSARTTAESAQSHQSDNSSSGGRGGDGGSAVMRAAMQQLQQLRLQRQRQQLEGVRRSFQGYPLQQQHTAEWE